jgi:hypothetical protein
VRGLCGFSERADLRRLGGALCHVAPDTRNGIGWLPFRGPNATRKTRGAASLTRPQPGGPGHVTHRPTVPRANGRLHDSVLRGYTLPEFSTVLSGEERAMTRGVRRALCAVSRTAGPLLPVGVFARPVNGVPGRVHIDDQMYRSDAPEHVRHYVEDAGSAMESSENPSKPREELGTLSKHVSTSRPATVV